MRLNCIQQASSTARQCVDKYTVLFWYYSLGDYTADYRLGSAIHFYSYKEFYYVDYMPLWCLRQWWRGNHRWQTLPPVRNPRCVLALLYHWAKLVVTDRFFHTGCVVLRCAAVPYGTVRCPATQYSMHVRTYRTERICGVNESWRYVLSADSAAHSIYVVQPAMLQVLHGVFLFTRLLRLDALRCPQAPQLWRQSLTGPLRIYIVSSKGCAYRVTW